MGSPRKAGNTAALIARAAEGARSKGAAVEVVRLADLKIEPCEVCNSCARKGKCVKDDGMQGLYQKMLWADAFVVGTPIYWWGPSALTKLFVDRWYAFDSRREAFHGKPLAVISPHNSSSPNMSEYVFGMFRSIAGYLGMPVVGMQWAVSQPLGRLNADSPSAKEARMRRQPGRAAVWAGLRSAVLASA